MSHQKLHADLRLAYDVSLWRHTSYHYRMRTHHGL